MKFSTFKHSRKAFTLVELMISLTIFGIMSTMTILIYFNVSETSRRMDISREISETAREITERISEDVRSRGIDTKNNQIFMNWTRGNYQNGSEVLGILPKEGSTDSRYYVYGKRDETNGNFSPCSDIDKSDNSVHCGLYIADKDSNSGNYEYYDLVDSFRQLESKKRVKITDLKFYISGDDTTAKKTTLKMSLSLLPRAGIPVSLAEATKLEIQTTVSERSYKIR